MSCVMQHQIEKYKSIANRALKNVPMYSCLQAKKKTRSLQTWKHVAEVFKHTIVLQMFDFSTTTLTEL